MIIRASINLTKLDKERFFKGKKGTYADLTLFVNKDFTPDEYGQHGIIKQELTQEERQNGEKLPIVGNIKILKQ